MSSEEIELDTSSSDAEDDTMSGSKQYRNSVYRVLNMGKDGGGGDFAVSGELKNAPTCVIDVQGYGEVSFPIFTNQAVNLIKYLELAPFGKGTQTVVDTSVRNCWELSPTKFQILNPKWDEFINTEVLSRVVTGFEFGTNQIQATLYKLLVYEAGSFFKLHRDTEKEQGMFGTMIIQLPSQYEGGTLVIKHDGNARQIDFSADENNRARAFATFFCAFYCDCEHELLPVVKGYRSCLVYNLSAKNNYFTPVAPPPMGNRIDTLIDLFKKWPLETQTKLVFVLSHEYSEAGLSFRTLKSTDRGIANTLRSAAEQHSMFVGVGHLTKHDSGQCEDDNGYDDRDGYSFFSKRRRTSPQGRKIFDEDLSTDYEFNVLDSLNADFIGMKLNINLEEEVLQRKCFKNITKPDEEEYAGYTGNCPGTLDQWYKLTAVIFWPISLFFKIAKSCKLPQQQILMKFIEMVDTIPPKQEENVQVLKLSQELLTCLGAGPRKIDGEVPEEIRMLSVISDLGDLPLLQRYLQTFCQMSPKLLPFVVDQLDKHGWESLLPQLQLIVDSVSKGEAVEWFQGLADACTSRDTDAATSTVVNTLKYLLSKTVPKSVELPQRSWYFSSLSHHVNCSSDVDFFSCIFPTCCKLGVDVTQYLASISTKQILKIYGPAYLKIADSNPELISHQYFVVLTEMIQSHLQTMITGYEMNKPTWVRSEIISCSCADSKALQAFLSSTRKTENFKMGKDRRRHLHEHMNSMINITHETTRVGSPHTLVVTKTHVTKKAEEAENCRKLLAEIRKVSQNLPVPVVVVE